MKVAVIQMVSGTSLDDNLRAARALLAHTELDAKSIATEALGIAGDICIYTNRNIVVEQL